MSKYDIVVIGGGIIGLATALRITEEYPRYKVAVLEKEEGVAMHQSGHNSGVIHAGIYYAPGSQKASFCRDGAGLLRSYCASRGLPYELCGKLIVALDAVQVSRLDQLYRRGIDNGVEGLELVEGSRIQEIEPNAAGIKAIHSPNTGIVDYTAVADAISVELLEKDVLLLTGTQLLSVDERDGHMYMNTASGELVADWLINCAGLHADVLAAKMGLRTGMQIIPFRGEFFSLKPDKSNLVKGLIYPVPDPDLPFLGVHFTRRIDGSVEAGPNAVLSLAREGYRKTDINVRDLADVLAFPGFWKMSSTHWATGIKEQWRSISKSSFLRSLRELVPVIQKEDLVRPSAGVRAQAVGRNGELIQDFRIIRTSNSIHVLNAPSPGATACFSIGRYIVDQAGEAFNLAA